MCTTGDGEDADKASYSLTILWGWSAQVSNYRSNQTLDEYLKAQVCFGPYWCDACV